MSQHLPPLTDSVYEITGLSAQRANLQRPELAFLLSDFTALPTILLAIGEVHDLAALEALVADPNTPIERLAALAGLFPAAFCANPAQPLLLFERPGLPAEMPAPSLGRLLAYAHLPADFALAAAHFARADLAAAARRHVALVGEAGADWPLELERELLNLPTIPEDDLLAVLILLDLVPAWLRPRLALSAQPSVAAALSGRVVPLEAPAQPIAPFPADTPAADLRRAADADDRDLRVAAALSAAADGDLLRWMKEQEDRTDADYAVYAALASNPRTPPETLTALAGDGSALATRTRRAVARNPNAPPAALAVLVEEPYAADIRLALLAHPALEPSLRQALAVHSLEQARYGEPLYRAIFLSQSRDRDLLYQAAYAADWLQRLAVAYNSHTPPVACALLRQDGHQLVRAAAQAFAPQ